MIKKITNKTISKISKLIPLTKKRPKLRSITDINLIGKTVLIRVDFNVPTIKKGNRLIIKDNEKIKASLITIKYFLRNDCKIILMTHFGRPKGRNLKLLRTNLVAKELRKLLPKNRIIKVDDCLGQEVKDKIEKAKNKEIILLENLRFYDEEIQNDYSFAHSLANLADIYINDAFAVSHREHASVCAITKFIPAYMGLLLETELLNLNKAFRPQRPSVWIMGGSKLNKINLIESAIKNADKILIGGALAFPFLKAKGYNVGHSLCDQNSVKIATKIIKNNKRYKNKIVLPIDFICSKRIAKNSKAISKDFNNIESDEIGLDIGPKTVQLFNFHILNARTIIWNGPLGYFEIKKFQKGSQEIANSIAKSQSFSIIGGGESSEMIEMFKLKKKISHISTGGGASITYLSNKKLPAIKALLDNFKLFN
ncbi:phosphoglycerate kinase [archaeon]|jgi:phosphoglycerate kinase|nr:phosphoglycerate kinase [archaeon]MBT3450416.1 phosphoglycerate kinase [archaeon]MBT6869123.1 phosphoglycerate kinase [archaeon]MBT7192770.1 phosphoglycerate kinase [archaeon]MBT7381310.1 phosphoglycerate kinase [archaeon]